MTLNFGNNLFPSQGEAITSFNWTDISNGTGFQNFYLTESEDSSGKDHHLITNRDYSNSVEIWRQNTGTTTTNYDLEEFKLPQNIKGSCYLSIPMNIGASETGRILAQLYKVGDSTDAITAEITGTTLSSGTHMIYLKLPLTEDTHFKKGEFLRLVIKLEHIAYSGGRVRYGQDPADRTDVNLSITTTSKLIIGFDIKI